MTGPATTRSASTTVARTPVQTASLVFGLVFLIVGVLGFIPGITTDYGKMSFAEYHSGAMLFGIFQISVLHNLVHLAYGVVGVAAAKVLASARTYLIVGGMVYLALWLYGLFINGNSAANWLPMNTADNWLHFVLGLVMIGAVFLRPPATATVDRPVA